MELSDRLARARSGGAVLFCGAGFSADCLSIQIDEPLGAGATLLKMLNDDLASEGHPSYAKLTNASEKYFSTFGETRLLALLKNKFQTGTVTDAMEEITRYPWSRIYTTNYDDAIENCLRRNNKRFETFNNLDAPQAPVSVSTQVIHLHGFRERWTHENFRKSVILSWDSYRSAPDVLAKWLRELERDFNNAEVFVFAGFSLNDIHIEQALHNLNDKKPRVFFVNRETSAPDPDSLAEQSRYGRTLPIGISGFAKLLRELPEEDPDPRPHTPSLARYDRPEAAARAPSIEDLKDLLIFGKFDLSQLVRKRRPNPTFLLNP